MWEDDNDLIMLLLKYFITFVRIETEEDWSFIRLRGPQEQTSYPGYLLKIHRNGLLRSPGGCQREAARGGLLCFALVQNHAHGDKFFKSILGQGFG